MQPASTTMPATVRSNSRIRIDRPSPKRHQAERREQLHYAEDGADAEEISGAAIHQRQHDDRAGHDGERPHTSDSAEALPRASSSFADGVKHDDGEHDERR